MRSTRNGQGAGGAASAFETALLTRRNFSLDGTYQTVDFPNTADTQIYAMTSGVAFSVDRSGLVLPSGYWLALMAVNVPQHAVGWRAIGLYPPGPTGSNIPIPPLTAIDLSAMGAWEEAFSQVVKVTEAGDWQFGVQAAGAGLPVNATIFVQATYLGPYTAP